SGSRGTVQGDLTLKGVTRPVELDVEYLGFVTDPWGGERAIYSASASINREDWGITWNMALEAGGLLVSKEIRLELELETVRERGALAGSDRGSCRLWGSRRASLRCAQRSTARTGARTGA